MNKSWIANAVTATNALFGGLSIMMSVSGHYQLAAVFILIAMVADDEKQFTPVKADQVEVLRMKPVATKKAGMNDGE